MLFFLKIAVPPLLVALVSIAARRWGTTFGGLIMGLPWMTGPVLFFLAIDKGEHFAIDACTGIELGVVAIALYALAYGALARVGGWSLSLPSAATAFTATAWLINGLKLALSLAAAFGAASLLVVFLLLPKPRARAVPRAPPWWDIPIRMLATLVLVAGIMMLADRLGPRLSGIVSTYPVVLTVVGSFTHHQLGADAVLRILRGIMLSLLSFVAFFFVAGTVIDQIGLVIAYALAAGVAVAMSAALIATTRRTSRAKK
jgi:hypothetical protein